MLSFVIMFCLTLPVFATADPALEVIEIEYYADGSYGVISLKNEPGRAPTGTVTKTKTYDYYDSNNVRQWQVSLTASFSYNGVTASCTSATPGHAIYNNTWQVTKETASISGATATGIFTVKKYVLGIPYQTVNKTLTLTCSPNGTVT